MLGQVTVGQVQRSTLRPSGAEYNTRHNKTLPDDAILRGVPSTVNPAEKTVLPSGGMARQKKKTSRRSMNGLPIIRLDVRRRRCRAWNAAFYVRRSICKRIFHRRGQTTTPHISYLLHGGQVGASLGDNTTALRRSSRTRRAHATSAHGNGFSTTSGGQVTLVWRGV